MKIKTKCSAWDDSVTEFETEELVRSYLFKREFHHAYLGDACIGHYGDYLGYDYPNVFEIEFEHCPGKAYVTLVELLTDELCMQAYATEREEINRIFGPYVAHQIALIEKAQQRRDEEVRLNELAKHEYFRKHGFPSSTQITTEIEKEPRKSIRIVISRSSSDDEIVVEPQGQSARTTKLTSVP